MSEAIGLFPIMLEYSRKTKLDRLAKHLPLLKSDALGSLYSPLCFYAGLKCLVFKVGDDTKPVPDRSSGLIYAKLKGNYCRVTTLFTAGPHPGQQQDQQRGAHHANSHRNKMPLHKDFCCCGRTAARDPL